jgi:hypothetical protein
MESLESQDAGFPPFPHPLEILSGFPHFHGFDDGCYIFKTGKPSRKPATGATFAARGL